MIDAIDLNWIDPPAIIQQIDENFSQHLRWPGYFERLPGEVVWPKDWQDDSRPKLSDMWCFLLNPFIMGTSAPTVVATYLGRIDNAQSGSIDIGSAAGERTIVMFCVWANSGGINRQLSANPVMDGISVPPEPYAYIGAAGYSGSCMTTLETTGGGSKTFSFALNGAVSVNYMEFYILTGAVASRSWFQFATWGDNPSLTCYTPENGCSITLISSFSNVSVSNISFSTGPSTIDIANYAPQTYIKTSLASQNGITGGSITTTWTGGSSTGTDLIMVASWSGSTSDLWRPGIINDQLFSWHQMDLMSEGNGVAVAAIYDYARFHRDMTMSGSPTAKTNAQNSLKAINMDGASMYGTFATMTGVTSSTCFFVTKAKAGPSDTTYGGILDTGSQSATINKYTVSGQVISDYMSNAGKSAASGLTVNVWHMAGFWSATNDWGHHMDGVDVFTTATNTASPRGTTSYFSRDENASWPYRGEVGELILGAVKFGYQNRIKTEGYLPYKWGLTSRLPSNHAYKNTPPKLGDIDFLCGNIVAPNGTGNTYVSTDGLLDPELVFTMGPSLTAAGTNTQNRLLFGAAVSASERACAAFYSRNLSLSSETARVLKSDYFASVPAGSGTSSATNAFDFVKRGQYGFQVNFATNLNGQIYPYLAMRNVSKKVGYFDLNTSTGNQAITGVGFPPKIVLLFTSAANNTEGWVADAYFSFGAAVSSSKRFSHAQYDDDNQNNAISRRYYSDSHVYTEITDSGVIAQADLQSMDSDGFTIDVETAPGAARRILYVAIGGSNLQADVGRKSTKTSTGTQAYTGVGFLPKMLMTIANDLSSGSLDTVSNDCEFSMGWTTGGTDQQYTLGVSENNAGTMNTGRRLSTTKCLGTTAPSDETSVTTEASLTSFDTDGFTLNFSTANATAREFHYIALGQT